MDEDAVLALAILAAALGAILLMFVLADIGTAPEARSALGLIHGLGTR